MVWALYVVGAIAVTIVLLAFVLARIGAGIPETHVASLSLRMPRTTGEQVWLLISDATSYPEWAAGVNKVERLPVRNGHEVFRQRMGHNSFVLETTRAEPPRLLERTIGDDHGPFSGSWTYEIRPEGAGCVVTLTERGRVKSALPRAVMKHCMGYHLYITKHLNSLAAKFGEQSELFDKTVG